MLYGICRGGWYGILYVCRFAIDSEDGAVYGAGGGSNGGGVGGGVGGEGVRSLQVAEC